MSILLQMLLVTQGIINAAGFDHACSREEITAITQVGSDWWVATFDGGVVMLDVDLHLNGELTVAGGLPSIHATALSRDGNDGAWIGTIAGPTHCDSMGRLESPADFAGLRTSDINAITMVDDKLWIATNEGARLYDPRYAGKPAWDRLPALPELEPVMKNQWGEVPRLLQTDRKTGKLISKPTRLYLVTPGGTVLDDLYSILWDGDSVWMGGAGRLFRYVPADDFWLTYHLPPGNQTCLLIALAEMDGMLYVGTDAGIFLLKTGPNYEGKIASTSFPQWEINAVLSVEGRMLLGCDHGIYRYDPEDDTFYCLRRLPANAQRVTALARCEQGWLVGSDAGLWLYPADWVSVAPQRIDTGGTLPRSDVWASASADDGVWLATGKGLALWRDGEAAPQKVEFTPCKDGCRTLINANNVLWVDIKAGLIKLETSDLTKKPVEVKNLANTSIAVLAEKIGGGIWACSGNAIYAVEQDGRVTHAFMLPPQCERITDLRQDGGRLYAGTWGMGLVALDAQTGRLVQIYDESYALGSNLVYCIHPLAPGRMLVGQQDAGLDVVDLTSGEPLWHLSSWDGLGSSDILAVLDEPGELWISVRAAGLNRVDKADGRIESISSRSGLGDNYIKDIVRSGDHVYLATAGGCVRINSPRKAGIMEYWEKEAAVETTKPSGRRATREVTYAVPGMTETKNATPTNPVSINQ